MIRLASLSIALLAAGVMPAQNQSGFIHPSGIVRTWGSAVQPAGTSALPGVQRFTGNAVYPAGGSSAIGIPGITLNQGFGLHQGSGFHQGFGWNQGFGVPPSHHGGGRQNSTFIYTVPVYVGGGYYDSSYFAPPPQPPVQQQQQPNVTVIYPPPATPVVIYPSDTQGAAPQYVPLPERAAPSIYEPPARTEDSSANQLSHFLIAFKDHTIYSAIAYWVDGDTLHYFTAGNNHNQVSVSLVDRALTERLNKDSGLEVRLPSAK